MLLLCNQSSDFVSSIMHVTLSEIVNYVLQMLPKVKSLEMKGKILYSVGTPIATVSKTLFYLIYVLKPQDLFLILNTHPSINCSVLFSKIFLNYMEHY